MSETIKAKQKPKRQRPKRSFDFPLAADLEDVLKRVGPNGYARATAAHFAPGGRYNPGAKRPRYAIM